MALLLAPYNEAMRIGMGFNSYTQQLCVNDVVRRPGGIRASEKDLRKVDHQKALQGPGSTQQTVLSEPSGTVIKNSSDGQSEVSQLVSWKAGFVDNLSDITNSLNISGALTITCAAIGGGGGAQAHFVDSTKFIKSDAKYTIDVQVTNQKLIADDVTEFTPIPNVPAPKFNEVYGDCFISGFIEGGVLSAVVLKTLTDDSSKKDIGGGINVNIDVSVATVKGEAEVGKVDENKKKHVETTISISWSGGGDIKPNSIEEWNVPTLTKVAMEFPDKVAICPQRTYAILTKYTSLRSFHEQTVKGSPLDYEIAGIYTSALLDSYMEYKAMWSDLHQTIKEIDRGTSRVRRRESDQKLVAYGEEVKEDYDKRMVRYNAMKQAIEKSSTFDTQVTLEEPLPPNMVEPYPADAFGLDKAARDCRFEMIKIVREVNEVTFDPKVATDPYRNWRYLSPNVFRLLLPTDKEPMPSPEEIAKMKSDLEATIKECTERQKAIDDAKIERDALKADKELLQKELSEQNEQQRRSTEEAETAIQRDAREKDLLEKLALAEAQANQLEKEKSETEQKLASLNSEYEKQKADAAEVSRAKDESLVKYLEASNTATQLQSELVSATRERDTFRSEAATAQRERDAIREEFNSGPEIAIHTITWGGHELLGNGGLEDKIRQYIQNYWGFDFNNDFFGGDTKPGHVKHGIIVYSRRGKKVVTVSGWENTRSAFY